MSDEQRQIEDELVRTVLASFRNTPDSRLKELMQALVRHLHAYIREVRLTEAEWQQAIDFLTAAGHITTDRRQEFVLLSDVLGASMQTINVNHEATADATEATVVGPSSSKAPQRSSSAATWPPAPGRTLLGRGHRHRHRRQPGPRRTP